MDKELSISLLRIIKEQGDIKLTRKDFDHDDKFEKAVGVLIDFEVMGFIEFCLPHEKNKSGRKIYDLVTASVITSAGKAYLEEMS